MVSVKTVCKGKIVGHRIQSSYSLLLRGYIYQALKLTELIQFLWYQMERESNRKYWNLFYLKG